MAAPHELDQHSNRLIDFPALSCELQKSTVYPEYPGWMGSTALLPAAFNGMKYVDAAHLLATSDTPALRAIGLCTIARSFYDKEGEVAMYEGKAMGVQELCLEALRCDRSSPMAYTFLGFLSDPSTVSFCPMAALSTDVSSISRHCAATPALPMPFAILALVCLCNPTKPFYCLTAAR